MADSIYSTSVNKKNIDSLINEIKTSGVIFIDGLNCCCKSSIISSFNNNKINNIFNCNESNLYNENANAAVNYLLLQHLVHLDNENVLFDRSPISNLAFQYIYAILNFKSKTYSDCINYTNKLNLQSTLEFLNGCNYNIIIIIDTNYNEWAKRILKRGLFSASFGDADKSIDMDYHYTQNLVYSYLGNCLNYKVFDLEQLRKNNISINDFVQKIKFHIKSSNNYNKKTYIQSNICAMDNFTKYIKGAIYISKR